MKQTGKVPFSMELTISWGKCMRETTYIKCKIVTHSKEKGDLRHQGAEF